MSLGTGVLGFIAVFGGFCVYALSAPPAFESRSTLEVRWPPGVERPSPLDAVLGFEAIVLDGPTLERLAAEHGLASKRDALRSVDVTTDDGQTVAVRCRARDAFRAQSICTFVVERALERASALASPTSSSTTANVDEGVRTAEALAVFSKALPELREPDPKRPIATEKAAEWGRLVRAAAAGAAPAEGASRAGAPIVRPLLAAAFPEAPVEPDRMFVLALGIAFGLLAGLVLGPGSRGRSATPSPTISRAQREDEFASFERPPPKPSPGNTPMLPPPPDGEELKGRAEFAATAIAGPPTPEPLAGVEATPGQAPVGLAAAAHATPVPPADDSYLFADLEAPRVSSLVDPVPHATAIFGSPVAPRVRAGATSSAPPPEPISSFPPQRASSSRPPPASPPTTSRPPMDESGARYSYVSSHPPKAVTVKVIDPRGAFEPDPRLRPAACKALRRELYAFGVESCFVIGISSSTEASDRKARFAVELALSLAESGHARVLFLDAASSQLSALSLLGVSSPDGAKLSEQLDRNALQETDGSWEVLRCVKSLHALGDGVLPTAGLQGGAFQRCIRAMRSNYDFVVVHGPALSDELRCHLLAQAVDGVLAISFAGDPQVRRMLGPFLTKRLARAVLCRPEAPVPKLGARRESPPE